MNFVDKVIKVTNKNSTQFGKTGLVSYQTSQMLYCVSFIEKTPDDCMFKSEILIKERPFRSFSVNKKSVEIIGDKTIDKKILKKARGQAYHTTLGYKTSKPYIKGRSMTVTYKCEK